MLIEQQFCATDISRGWPTRQIASQRLCENVRTSAAVAILADLGRASLVGRIPCFTYDSMSAATTPAPLTLLAARRSSL